MKFRVFVQVWCEVDPTLNIRVDRQTASLVATEGDVLTRVSPLGRYGVLEASRLRDAEITAFAVGDGHENALVHALASGASRAVCLRSDGSTNDANIMAGMVDWVAGERPDLVIADRQAGEMAARLGWAHLAGLYGLRHASGTLSAHRQFGRGAHEEVTAVLPAIVRLQTETPETTYVARARIDRARKLSIDSRVLPALDSEIVSIEPGPLQLSRPRTRIGTVAAAAPAKAMDRLNALMGLSGRTAKPVARTQETAVKSASDLAEEFVRYLAHHDLMNR